MDAELYCSSFSFESSVIQKTKHSHYLLFTNTHSVHMDLNFSVKELPKQLWNKSILWHGKWLRIPIKQNMSRQGSLFLMKVHLLTCHDFTVVSAPKAFLQWQQLDLIASTASFVGPYFLYWATQRNISARKEVVHQIVDLGFIWEQSACESSCCTTARVVDSLS